MNESKGPHIPDLSEKGRDAAGQVITSNRRLFMQLLVFTGCSDGTGDLIRDLDAASFPATLYLDVNHPQGIGLMTASEDPDFFVTTLRSFLNTSAFSRLSLDPDFTMLGRSYSIGYEGDLDHVLIHRPLERISNPEWPWAVWYPLRRAGAFERLTAKEQTAILSEHGTLGAAFSAGGFGNDVRLDCRGIDKHDNDFVIGLIGKELFPLSAMVQAMRKTRQTSEFLEKLGPFFVGKAVWQRGPT